MTYRPQMKEIIAVIDIPVNYKKNNYKNVIDLCLPEQKARSLIVTEKAFYLSPQTVAYYKTEYHHHYPQL